MSAVALRARATKVDEAAVREAFERATKHLAKLDEQVFTHMRASANPDVVEQVLPLTLDALRPLVEELTQALSAQARRVALASYADVQARTRKAHPFGDGTFVLQPEDCDAVLKAKKPVDDESNPFADRDYEMSVREIRARTAKLVVDINNEQRRALKKVIARRFDPDSVANDTLVKDIKATVGLTERESVAVMNLRDKLEDNNVSAPRVENQIKRYSEKLHKLRAQRIARTETVRVETAGRRAGWGEAQKDGLLSKSAKVEWVMDAQACPVCRDLDGKTASLDGGTFKGPEGAIHGPPAHPHCGCDVVVTDEGD